MNRPKRILIVDDEEFNRELLEGLVETLGHEPVTAQDGFEALEMIPLDIDLVLLDVMMPGMDGFEVARHIRGNPDYSNIPVIIVTALHDREARLTAVKAGADDFIAKPVDRIELEVRLKNQLDKKEAQDANKHYQAELESMVEERTAKLRRALDNMTTAQRNTYEAHLDTIQRLVVAAEFKDEDTAAHIHRMSLYSTLLAERLNLPEDEVELIRIASPMHDVGKIGIPDAILLKQGKLTPDEWEIMKRHTTFGAHILEDSPSKLLQAGRVICLSHHEKWDGSGYPKGLAGEDIPLWGRICVVADVFDALTSKRPYKEMFSNEKAIAILKAERGKHFESRLVDLFIENIAEIVTIQEIYQD